MLLFLLQALSVFAVEMLDDGFIECIYIGASGSEGDDLNDDRLEWNYPC